MKAYDKLMAARNIKRATSQKYIDEMITDFAEMHGDRLFGDDGAVICGIGFLRDMPVTIIGIEKGADTKEKIKRNFGAANPEGYRKALRQMKLAEKFGRPVICLVDTSGAYCGIGAEERGQGSAIAQNLMEMVTLKTPVISIVIGEGGSGGALALSVADEIWMLENAVYSVISPEGCASILWKDSAKAADAAECLKITAQDLYEFGIAERVIEEPESFADIYPILEDQLYIKLKELQSKKIDELLKQRYEKFRKIGDFI